MLTDQERFGILICPTEPPKSRKFIAYEVREDKDELVLSAIYEVNYPHPDAPEHAVHPKIEIHEIMRVARGQMLYNAVYLMLAAQEALKKAITATTK